MTEKLSADLLRVRINLSLRFPFFDSLLAKVEKVADDTTPTVATDGRRMFINPEYFTQLSKAYQEFVIANLLMKLALQHVERLGDHDRTQWNEACDHVTNMMLKDMGMTMPPGVIMLDDMTAEQVYAALFAREDH